MKLVKSGKIAIAFLCIMSTAAGAAVPALAVKLSVISKMLGYKYHAHDALEDVKATRYVYDTLTEWVKRQRAEAKVSRVDT